MKTLLLIASTIMVAAGSPITEKVVGPTAEKCCNCCSTGVCGCYDCTCCDCATCPACK